MPENDELQGRRELAHPRVVLGWLILVSLLALAPVIQGVFGYVAR